MADFVQNSAIDPVTMPDTSMFDPLAVKGMTYQGQLYGVPYSIENIALIRNTDLAPECPATMEDLVATGQQLVEDKKATNIMALQVGQKGDAYHIYPLFTSGGGSFFGTTATGDPDGSNVTVDSAESIAAGQKLFDLGEKGVGALKRSVDDKNAIPLFTGGKTPFLVSGPWAIADIKKAGVNYDVCAIPAFADGKPAVAVHRRQRLLSRQQGQEQDARPGVPHERRPDRRLPVRPVRGRPAPPGADRVRHRGSRRGPEHPEVRGGRCQRHDPARDPRDGTGLEPVRHRRGSDRGRDRPVDGAHGRRQGDPRRDRQPVADDPRDAAGRSARVAPAASAGRPTRHGCTAPARRRAG